MFEGLVIIHSLYCGIFLLWLLFRVRVMVVSAEYFLVGQTYIYSLFFCYGGENIELYDMGRTFQANHVVPCLDMQ